MATSTLAEGPTGLTRVSWRDGKRYLWLLGLVVPLLPLIAWGLVEATGSGLLWWYGPIFIFAILPVIDTLIGNRHITSSVATSLSVAGVACWAPSWGRCSSTC